MPQHTKSYLETSSPIQANIQNTFLSPLNILTRLFSMSSANSSAPVWLVTGVSSGFGTHIARFALDAGYRVVGTVRSKSKSAATTGPLESRGMHVVELDYTATQSTIAEIVTRDILPIVGGRVDVLINNGAYAALGPLERYE